MNSAILIFKLSKKRSSDINCWLLKKGRDMSNSEVAAQLFQNGCACSQAVLVVYGESLGLSKKMAMQIAAGFAGGMRLGETCGAVTGAFMVIGLRYASEACDTVAGRANIYARVIEFANKFQKLNGSITCRTLLGYDISNPEGMKQAHERNLFKTTCVKMVQDAVVILDEMEMMTESQKVHAANRP